MIEPVLCSSSQELTDMPRRCTSVGAGDRRCTSVGAGDRLSSSRGGAMTGWGVGLGECWLGAGLGHGGTMIGRTCVEETAKKQNSAFLNS